MNDDKWEVVYETYGPFQAELLRGLLEAQEIPVVLSQEGVGKVYSLTVGTLGLVQILVPVRHLGRARRLLAAYEAGEYLSSDYPLDEEMDDLGSELEEP